MKRKPTSLYARIRDILEVARVGVARTVNTTQVMANWLIGREIVEEEQRGSHRAEYGKQIVEELAVRLQNDFGKGYSALNLWLFRRFYIEYPDLAPSEILYAPRKESGIPAISDAVRRKIVLPLETCAKEIPPALRALSSQGDEKNTPKGHAVCYQTWQPGLLHPNLSWTHYRTLLRVEKPEARAFYEIEVLQNNWAARELERQINSLLFERLALSKDKKGLHRLAIKGQEVTSPTDVFKDPVVIEFTGTDKNDAVVRYTLGRRQQPNIFASRYKLHLPTVAELKAEIRREIRSICG